MESAVEHEREESEGSCFSRAARAIRRALARICGGTSSPRPATAPIYACLPYASDTSFEERAHTGPARIDSPVEPLTSPSTLPLLGVCPSPESDTSSICDINEDLSGSDPYVYSIASPPPPHVIRGSCGLQQGEDYYALSAGRDSLPHALTSPSTSPPRVGLGVCSGPKSITSSICDIYEDLSIRDSPVHSITSPPPKQASQFSSLSYALSTFRDSLTHATTSPSPPRVGLGVCSSPKSDTSSICEMYEDMSDYDSLGPFPEGFFTERLAGRYSLTNVSPSTSPHVALGVCPPSAESDTLSSGETDDDVSEIRDSPVQPINIPPPPPLRIGCLPALDVLCRGRGQGTDYYALLAARDSQQQRGLYCDARRSSIRIPDTSDLDVYDECDYEEPPTEAPFEYEIGCSDKVFPLPRLESLGGKRKYNKDPSSSIASNIPSPDYMLDLPPPGTLKETGIMGNPSSASFCSPKNKKKSGLLTQSTWIWEINPSSPFTTSAAPDQTFCLPNSKDTDDSVPSFDNSSCTFSEPSCSQSIAKTIAGPPCQQVRPAVFQDSNVCTEGSGAQDAFEQLSLQSDSEDGGDMEMEASVTAMNYPVAYTLPAHITFSSFSSDSDFSERNSSCLPRSHSSPSLILPSAQNQTFTRANSLPDMLLKTSLEEFTPDITLDVNDETYRFQCSCPGLYQCSVTGLVFHMEGEGDVVYRVVPWDRRQLAQHHKQPAGPLFDIECQQESVCQLHLPHCEIRSTGGCEFLSVAHVNDEGIEFISPHKITETHVVINIKRFSAFGNVKDEDSPPDPVRALVLLFYKPPEDPDPESILNVLLLPRNVVLQHVLRIRKKLVGDENYIETSPHCKLHPKQEYTLSTCPEDDSILVQPTEAEFDSDNYDNYFPSFQVSLEKVMKHIKLFLRHTDSSNKVWERKVCLSSTGGKRSCGQSALNLSPEKKLFEIRSSFIDGISGPVLKSLLNKLFEKKVINESERESADETQNRGDKARCVIDTVRKKGEAASKEMIEFLCELDSFLCEHLGLI